MNFRYLSNIITALVFLAASSLPVCVSALPKESYAENSRLAQGLWMKVAVEKSGMYMIPAATLRSWGFSDLTKVRVYGYGGRMLPLLLDSTTYVDDIPEVQSVMTQRGLVFYGVGAGEWTGSDLNHVHYEHNVFSTRGYYYIGESEEAGREIESTGRPGADNPTTTFMSRLHHERDLVSPGEAGPALVGEDFRYTNTRDFSFEISDAVPGGAAWLECSFVVDILTTGSRMNIMADGAEVGGFNVQPRINSRYIHGAETVGRMPFTMSASPSRTLKMTLSYQGGGSAKAAWLNYLSVLYSRYLSIPSSGVLEFDTQDAALALSGADSDTEIWDVTDPADVKRMNVALEGGTAKWSNTARRSYVAWKPTAAFPAPSAVGFVPNQNLHATPSVDMVIVTPSEFYDQAVRLAQYHSSSSDSLKVLVVEPGLIYNEFSSGVPDVGGLRRFFKMLYDREDGTRLRYAVLFGRTTLDNRSISTLAPLFPTLPSWMPTSMRASLSDNEGYCTDDITAMLEDGSGSILGSDKLSIAIGRIPATSAAEARSIVDKAIQYAAGARKTAWKQRFLFVADDEDGGEHLKQTENMIGGFEDDSHQQQLVRKVYVDAYKLEGGKTPGAKTTMNRYLDEGVVWWNFIGHANPHSWTSEGILTYTDINNMYLRHWPFIYAATCDFLRLDGNEVSGAETLYKERYGGAIGVVSAVRPVIITNNGYMSSAMGRMLSRRDEAGRLLPPGEMYRLAKNDLRDKFDRPVRDENRLRFTFIGDPALRLATPSNIVRVDSINGIEPTEETQITLAALSQGVISGTITDPQGNPLNDFNGILMLEIFDAERSVTTLGHGKNGTNDVFEEYGDRVFCGSATITEGRFTVNVAMPAELSQNFRPATMSLFAYDTNDDDEAVGLFRNFFVYGYDEKSAPDTTAPKIESLVLNHSSFKSGDAVNSTPMLIASIRDDIGINVSTAGIGHQMTALLDDKTSFSDLSFYFTPSGDGSPSGVINYPFETIQPGAHKLKLRVWDTSGNSASSEIEFFVNENMPPKIYEVYTDANPASDQANFYLSHDQPDVMATVYITVYDLMGRQLWSDSAQGRSDMFRTVPVTWDLCDRSGRRVPRGIYLYRAEITTDGQTYQTSSRRIAVTAQ